MKTAIRKGHLTAKAYGLKAVDGEPGVHEAIVSVFGNIDYAGDRVQLGAFTDTLAAWKSSGDPIPVVFSHQWDTLAAHIGEVLDAKELAPGDPMLPPELAANGGLWTRFKLDLGDPMTYADTVDRLLTGRRLKEFSFAYDVIAEAKATDGANDLTTLDLIEVGPTLKGMNPSTQLLKAFGMEADAFGGGLMALIAAGAKTVAHAFAPGDDDPTRCVLCNLTRNTVAHNANATTASTKAHVQVDFEGAIETELEAIYVAGVTWARGLDVGEGGFYALHQEATYPADLRAIVQVEGWEDGYGEGTFYELSFERADDGTLTVKDAAEIEVSVTLARKMRSMKHRASGGIVMAKEPPSGKSGASGTPKTRTGSEGTGGDPLLAELELFKALA
jgi:HK97 family phage prohead protease